MQTERGTAQIRQLGRRFTLDGQFDLFDTVERMLLPGDLLQDAGGLLVAIVPDEIPRRFGDQQRENAVHHRGNDADQEHPPPGLEPPPQRVHRVTAGRGLLKELVRQQRGEDTERDGQLLHRRERPAIARRCDLGDVGGSDHRRDTDAESADHTPDEQIPYRLRVGGSDGRCCEHHRTENHHAFATPHVGETTGEPRTDNATEQRDRDGEALEQRSQPEGVLDGVDGAVDHGTVEAEEESADGRCDADADDPRSVLIR